MRPVRLPAQLWQLWQLHRRRRRTGGFFFSFSFCLSSISATLALRAAISACALSPSALAPPVAPLGGGVECPFGTLLVSPMPH